jgi:hypothetical protein
MRQGRMAGCRANEQEDRLLSGVSLSRLPSLSRVEAGTKPVSTESGHDLSVVPSGGRRVDDLHSEMPLVAIVVPASTAAAWAILHQGGSSGPAFKHHSEPIGCGQPAPVSALTRM